MRISHIVTVSLALALAAAGPASAETGLTEEQSVALDAPVAEAGTLSVTGSVDRDDLTYGIGETVRFFVETNEDAYVTIVNIGPEGDVTQLFPNAFQPGSFVEANQRIEIPSADSGALIRVAGPVGAELIKIFASNEPVTFVPESQLEGDGAFRSLRGGVSALARNLEVVANAPPAPERKVAVQHLVLRTVAEPAADAAASPSFVAVPQDAPSEEAGAPAPAPEEEAAAPAAGEAALEAAVEEPAGMPAAEETAPTAALEEPAPARQQEEPASQTDGY